MHSIHTPLRKSAKSSTRVSARPPLRKDDKTKSVTREDTTKEASQSRVANGEGGKKSTKSRNLSPYSPSKKFSSPDKENVPAKGCTDARSPSNVGSIHEDQSKEDVSPLLQFQSPGTAKY